MPGKYVPCRLTGVHTHDYCEYPSSGGGWLLTNLPFAGWRAWRCGAHICRRKTFWQVSHSNCSKQGMEALTHGQNGPTYFAHRPHPALDWLIASMAIQPRMGLLPKWRFGPRPPGTDPPLSPRENLVSHTRTCLCQQPSRGNVAQMTSEHRSSETKEDDESQQPTLCEGHHYGDFKTAARNRSRDKKECRPRIERIRRWTESSENRA